MISFGLLLFCLMFIFDFSNTYDDFMSFFRNNDSITENVWECTDITGLGSILKKKIGVTAKKKELGFATKEIEVNQMVSKAPLSDYLKAGLKLLGL